MKDVHCNIVLQDKKQNHIVLTDNNIVLKGLDFFGDQHCEETHSVQHIWLPMTHQHKEIPYHWNGQESRHMMNYALPERRLSQNQNLNRMILMLTQPPSITPMMNRPMMNQPIMNQHLIDAHQSFQNRQISSDEMEIPDERINRAFEKQMNKLKDEILDKN